MFKVIFMLTAAATTTIGQLCDNSKSVTKSETVKKEIIIKAADKPVLKTLAEPDHSKNQPS